MSWKELQRQAGVRAAAPALSATCLEGLDTSLPFFRPLPPHLSSAGTESHDFRGAGPVQPPSMVTVITSPE